MFDKSADLDNLSKQKQDMLKSVHQRNSAKKKDCQSGIIMSLWT